jgi:AhpD family alkylhydroperoxidase
MTPRIAPGSLREAGPFAWTFAQISGLVTRTTPPNLFLTLGRQHKLFRGWLRFAGRLMPGGTLPRRDTELIILRVAHLRQCAYEFEHHVRLGARAGVTKDDVARVQAGPSADGWSERERILLAAVDQLHEKQDLDDELWTRLRSELDPAQVIEFLVLVGHYEMLATVLLTLRIEPDRPR